MKKYTTLWFLIGLGSQLQVLFSLSMTEILVLAWAPVLMFTELPYMKRDGSATYFYMGLLLVLGCIASLIYNRSPQYAVIRGISVTTLIWLSSVIAHHMLRKDMGGFKWYIVGNALSSIVCTFVFKKSVELAEAGASGDVTGNALFWVGRLNQVLSVPSTGWYLHVPLPISVVVPLFVATFALFTTASGRSAALSAMGASLMVLAGGRKRSRMRKLGQHILILASVGVVCVFCFKVAYQKLATKGMLGEKAQAKYEAQTKQGDSIIKLLIGGRADSFVGLLAIAESPFFGKGYWAEDTNHYHGQFLERYGTPEDVEKYYENLILYAKRGKMLQISAHSYITSFWLWYGLPGLFFWIYVLYCVLRYLKDDLWIVPQWYYWLAVSVPSFLWNVCFSPFSARVALAFTVMAMLTARAIRLGKRQMPFEIELEALKAERRGR